MKEFYDKIKDKMSEPPKQPTDWAMWDKVSNSVGEDNPSSGIPLWLWLPFLMALAGIGGYFLNSDSNHEALSSGITVTDTVYIHEQTIRTDTIYKTKYITQWRDRKVENRDLLSLNKLLLVDADSLRNQVSFLERKMNALEHAIRSTSLKYDPALAGILSISDEGNMKNTFPSEIGSIANLVESQRGGLNSLGLLQIPNYFIFQDGMVRNWKLDPVKITPRSPGLLESLIPDYVNIGISLGTPALNFSNGLMPGYEIGGQLHLELLFSPKFSLVTGIGAKNATPKTKDESLAMVYGLPDILDGDQFKELYLNTSSLQVPLLMKYTIRKGKTGKRYLIGGLIVNRVFDQEPRFEYLRGVNEIYYETDSNTLPWSFSTIQLGFGFERKIRDRLNIYAEPFGRYDFSRLDADGYKFHGLGVRWGVSYEL